MRNKRRLLTLLIASLAVFYASGASAVTEDTYGTLSDVMQSLHAETPHAETPATSGEEGHPHITEGKSETAQKKAGLPQLDPSWFPSQIFWLFCTFGAMYIVCANKILPELSTTIENRRAHIQNDLDTAHDLKEEAERAQKKYEELLSAAFQDTSALMEKNENEIKTKYDKALDTFRNDALQQINTLETQIAETKKTAMGDMHNIVADIASAAAKKIVGIDTDITQVRNVVKNIDKKAA